MPRQTLGELDKVKVKLDKWTRSTQEPQCQLIEHICARTGSGPPSSS